jgi:hypothetical protein
MRSNKRRDIGLTAPQAIRWHVGYYQEATELAREVGRSTVDIHREAARLGLPALRRTLKPLAIK